MKEINKKGENSADLAIKQLRILQNMFYRHDVSDNDLFNYTNGIIGIMEKASNEIRTNYEEISSKLTDLMNGRVQKRNEDIE
jgi:NAD+--asparagine ADP-ribosyltransferase